MKNLRQIRKKSGFTLEQVADALGVTHPAILRWENGDANPRGKRLGQICDLFQVSLEDLYGADKSRIAIAGKVGAGASVPLVDAYEKGNGLYHVACPSELNGKNIVGVEVEGDSMFPIYRGGDVLFYTRDALGVPTEAIGSICVCEDESGQGWVKLVKVGAEKGLFSLISINPQAESMHDVKLKWAAPVRLHWPRDLVEKM